MIKNIVFDIGNVLIDFAWKATMEELGFDEKCIDTLADGYINNDLWDEMDRGVLSFEEVIQLAVKAMPQYEKEIRLFVDNLILTIRPFDYSEQWVKDLKSKGFKVFLCTNYPYSTFEESVNRGLFPFYPYIDGKIVSSRVHLLKPSEDIFNALFEKYNLKAEECVFFDDKEKNVNGAKKTGMHGFVFEGYEKACKDLEGLVESLNN